MAKKTSPPWQQVLVRHLVASRRDDVTRLSSMLTPPFEESSSGSQGSGGTGIFSKPRGRWMVAIGFPQDDWAVLFTNGGTPRDLFDTNASNKRLEVAWIGFDAAQGGWFFNLNRGGKQIVRFAQAEGRETEPTIEADAATRKSLAGFPAALAALQQLCQQFEVPPRTKTVEARDDEFIVLGLSGKPVKAKTRGVVTFHGSALAPGENKAADRLAKAIEKRNPEEIRAAVAEGASLEVLPETSTSPLVSALFQAGKPRWKEAAETLIELGASVEKDSEGESPMASMAHNFVPEAMALVAYEFLLQHGSDPNATGPYGNPVLMHAVIDKRKACVELLLKYGADPALGDTLSWVRERIETDMKYRDHSEYAEYLTLLTGEVIQQPTEEDLSPELRAENERFDTCLQIYQVQEILNRGFQYTLKGSAAATQHPGVRREVERLEKLGFQRSDTFTLLLGFEARPFVALTHPKKNVDAVLSVEGPELDTLRVELGVYLPDGNVMAVTNREPQLTFDYRPTWIEQSVFSGADAAALLKRLEEKLRADRRSPIALDMEGFRERHRKVTQRVLDEMMVHVQAILDAPAQSGDGEVPRYERLRCYYNWGPNRSPTDSTARVAQQDLESIAKALTAPPDRQFTKEMGMRAAVDLLLARHVQWAGAPCETSFLADGTELAVGLFEHQAQRAKPYDQHWMVEELELALLLVTVADDWDKFRRICEALRAKFADPKMRMPEQPTADAAQFWLMLASHFRTRKFPKLGNVLADFEKSRKKRYKLLWNAWQAIEAKSAERFQSAMVDSLQQFRSRSPARAENLYDLRKVVAIPESILHAIALHQGLPPVDLPKRLTDYLITPASIGRRPAAG